MRDLAHFERSLAENKSLRVCYGKFVRVWAGAGKAFGGKKSVGCLVKDVDAGVPAEVAAGGKSH